MPSAAGQPQSLTDEAYQLLRRQVLDCELLPGQWLSERQVSADIGIGLSPVRGALARLDLADERFELLCQVAGNSIMTEIYRRLAGDQRRGVQLRARHGSR